ncbi:hypothetical protein [Sporosarcina sp. E16_8]|uniref:hypothetical protein n=1 Tax=Sporosarcina sp. E16_8 TaxID=2789295 RepID=UPI001A93475C|nr:hypothetical protein [Sporosarcina sp. E16_8]MBO0586115.1 hypothetical protein [Sporosarcina sp. E16_8]
MATKGQVMKDQGAKVTLLDGKERTLKFDLNALCELENKGLGFEELVEGLSNRSFGKIRTILHSVLAHEEDDDFTEKKAAALIDMSNFAEVVDALGKAFSASTPEQSETEVATEDESGK